MALRRIDILEPCDLLFLQPGIPRYLQRNLVAAKGASQGLLQQN